MERCRQIDDFRDPDIEKEVIVAHIVKLSKASWEIGLQIYAGGFGMIYEGFRQGSTDPVAIKFTPKIDGTNRDLLLADVSGRESKKD